MLFFVHLSHAAAIALCIVSNMLNNGWVGILIVGDGNMSSPLYASGDGGEILVRIRKRKKERKKGRKSWKEWQCGRYAYLDLEQSR